MGKYTDLARVLGDTPQREEAVDGNKSVNINNIYSNRDNSIDKPTSERPKDTLQGPPPVDSSQSRAIGYNAPAVAGEKSATNLRTTNLTNLTDAERCVHELAPKKCAVCNGYARWLIAGGAARIEEARSSPEGTRRLYWQLIEGGKV